jgi:hypothetical protein
LLPAAGVPKTSTSIVPARRWFVRYHSGVKIEAQLKELGQGSGRHISHFDRVGRGEWIGLLAMTRVRYHDEKRRDLPCESVHMTALG